MHEYQDTRAVVEIGDNRTGWNSPGKLRPGLHGRARIWGPNRTVKMILLTTALMG